MERTIDEIAKKIKDIANRRERLANTLHEIDGVFTPQLKLPINDFKLDKIKICGVDGGFLRNAYHGAGIILRRAVAVCFTYQNNKLVKTDYHPDRRPIPDPIVVGPEFSESDFNTLANLKRVEIELKTAIEAIQKFRPDVMLLDGSVVLYPSNMPEKRSPVYSTYQEVVKLFKTLYQTCSDNNILLAGAVEDSRGKRYCNLLFKDLFPRLYGHQSVKKSLKEKLRTCERALGSSTDTLFLYYLLEKGEYTTVMKYAEGDIPILKDLGNWAKTIHAIYIKAVEYDRPLRLDFVAPNNVQETANKLASIVWQISKHNRTYAYPSVLIEADARAKLSENEIAIFKSRLTEKLGRNPSLFELRRDLRPF